MRCLQRRSIRHRGGTTKDGRKRVGEGETQIHINHYRKGSLLVDTWVVFLLFQFHFDRISIFEEKIENRIIFVMLVLVFFYFVSRA